MRSVDVGSVHYLSVFRMKVEFKRASTQSVNEQKMYNATLLKDKTEQSEFRITLGNSLQTLEKPLEEETATEKWKVVKEAVKSSCQQALGPKKYTQTSTEALEKIDERKE